MWARTAKLESALARRPPATRPRLDLSSLSDTELEVLLPLAAKAGASGGVPAWSGEELALLTRSAEKLAAAGAARCG